MQCFEETPYIYSALCMSAWGCSVGFRCLVLSILHAQERENVASLQCSLALKKELCPCAT
eukprot:m.754711 g.754711  ORF g.754711 m.754711 type:complete len:60 (-) comp23177_c0_seq1:109-288(-)